MFTVAVAIRFLHVWQLHQSPFSWALLGDAVSYDAWARQIASGDWRGTGVFYQAPLYPYFLGSLYALIGHDLAGVRIVQALLGAGACALLYFAGVHLFSRRAGLIAGLLLACYPPAIFFDGLLQKASLDLVFSCWLLLVVTLVGVRTTPMRAASLGLAMGCLILTRENALVLLPVAAGWLIVRARPVTQPLLAFGVALALVLLPVGVRNLTVGGEFHLTTSQFGPNFYIGNNEHATGTYMALRTGRGTAEFERTDATELAQDALGRTLTPGEVSEYWSARAFTWIRENPVPSARLFAKKLLLTWNEGEAVDTEDLQTHAEWSAPLRWLSLGLHFGVIAPLGLLGMWVTRSRWRDVWSYYAMCLVYSLSVAAFYVLARYRYPLVPVLVLFAGPGILWLVSEWRRSAPATATMSALALIAIAVVVNWPLVPSAAMSATTHFNLGQELQTRGQQDEAMSEYRKALALWPQLAAAHSNLGVLLAARQKFDEAAAHYRDAVNLDPSLVDAQVNLGIEVARRGSRDQAVEVFRKALTVEPANAAAHYNLGVTLASGGDMANAIDHLKQAVAANPKYFEAHNNLAVLLATTGQLAAAITHFEAAAALRPDDASTAANLARARAMVKK